jgi:hypothetical protein
MPKGSCSPPGHRGDRPDSDSRRTTSAAGPCPVRRRLQRTTPPPQSPAPPAPPPACSGATVSTRNGSSSIAAVPATPRPAATCNAVSSRAITDPRSQVGALADLVKASQTPTRAAPVGSLPSNSSPRSPLPGPGPQPSGSSLGCWRGPGEYDRAEQLARCLTRCWHRTTALSYLAQVLAPGGEYEHAEQVARTIAKPGVTNLGLGGSRRSASRLRSSSCRPPCQARRDRKGRVPCSPPRRRTPPPILSGLIGNPAAVTRSGRPRLRGWRHRACGRCVQGAWRSSVG